jgi:SpoIID/LytB domain protein
MSDGATVVDANYSKCCGGVVEDPGHVWGHGKAGLAALADAPRTSALSSLLPVTDANIDAYLASERSAASEAYCAPASVSDDELRGYLGRVDRGGGHFRWSISHERTELEAILRRSGCAPADLAALDDLTVTQRGVSGRATEVRLAYLTDRGERAVAAIRDQYRIRQALHSSFLFSSAFRVRVERDAAGAAVRFHLDGAGWGHGAGLCQIGALGMALAGHDFRAILEHYFPTARLETAYST